MSTLQVTNIITANGTTDLVVKTGNTTGPQIVIAANGQSITLRGNSSSNSVFINSSAVYINGSIPSANITNLTATGSVVISGNVTPTIITSNTSAWNPGTSNAYVIRLQANAAGTASNTAIYEAYISGLVAGTNGQIIILSNISSQKIQLRNEDSVNETTAANRFSLPNNIWLGGYQSLKIIYDGTLARWRPMNSLLIQQYGGSGNVDKGFFSGGYVPAPGTVVTTAERTTYSSETTASVSGAALSQSRGYHSGVGNADKGFFSGGTPGPASSAVADKTTYSSETTAAVTGADLTEATYYNTACGNSEKGIILRGYGGISMDRTTYASETNAALTSGANLSQTRYYSASTSGNPTKGFFMGGSSLSPGATVATADRTTFSTETTAAVSGANLSQARLSLAAVGNADKGFFSGGSTPTPATVATTDRTTYSTETTAAVVGANLSQARIELAGAGNVDKGFLSGGYTAPLYRATADRTTYSTETTAAVTGANLSGGRSSFAAI
jgi:hypothetical protein